MISIIYQILKLILMSISCHWSVVLVQGYILKQYNTLPPQSLRLLGNDSFLGQAPARECGCGWLNFWFSMVSSVFSQAMAILPKGILAYDEHLPEMEFPRRMRFVGVWSQKEIICELSKKKSKGRLCDIILQIQKKIWLSFRSWVLSSGTLYKYREYFYTLLIFFEL